MPQFIAGLLIAALGLTAGTAAAYVVTALVYIAFAAGLYFLSYLLTPRQTTKPSDVTVSFRRAVGPRYRHYGQVKTSGQWVFCGSKNGALYKVLALGQGPFTSIESYWIDSNNVTLDSNGHGVSSVTLSGATSLNYGSFITIASRLGTETQTHFTEIEAAFPQWDSTHRGKGVAALACIQNPIDNNYFSTYFPNSWNTNYRVIAKTTKIENPVTNTTGYDDNAADIIRDFLYSEYGLRLSRSLLTTPLAQAGWVAAHNKSAVPYNLKAGGTEKRYRIWGSYTLEDRPSDVLTKMLAACDGKLRITSDGGLTLDVGDYVEPDVIFTDDDIVGFSEFGHGKDVLTTANILKATFTSPKQDYLETDADEWIDQADVDERGAISTSAEFLFAPSHAQCRRLMKINAARLNPTWTGTFELNVKGLNALSERFVRIKYTPFNLDAVFEINKLTINTSDGNIVKGCTITVTSMPSSAFSWDADSEEGTEPAMNDIDDTTVIPVPTGFNAVIQRRLVSGVYYPFAHLSWDAPSWASLYVTAEYKLSTDTTWTTIGSNISDLFIDSPLLNDGSSYNFRIAQSTFSGKKGDYASTLTLTAVADTTAPGLVTNVGKTGGTGQVALTWRSPNSSNYVAATIYRNTTNSEAGAVLAHTEWGPPSTTDGYTETGLAASTYYFWIHSRNSSGVESAGVATGAVTVS